MCRGFSGQSPREALQSHKRQPASGEGVATYHLHVKNISRGDGRSVVAAAAYRAGETLPNEAEERDSNFGGRRDVVHTAIVLPAGAPAWMADRAQLWNAVEKVEKRKDARLAKEIEFSLPRELPPPLWASVARAMADVYASQGYVVDLAVHDDGERHNPHVHLLLTTRAVTADGFGGKLREADSQRFVTDARATWRKIANVALGVVGAGVEIDERSNAARGIDERPGVHRGPDAAARRARREGRGRMQLGPEARAAWEELLRDKRAVARFPLLSAREDWPPAARAVPRGLSDGEQEEFWRFWQEVDRRSRDEPPQEPEWSQDAVVIERGEKAAAIEERALARVQKNADRREAENDRLMPAWHSLHESLRDYMRKHGHDVSHPLQQWENVEKAIRRFEHELAKAQEREARSAASREAYRRFEDSLEPMPDPNGQMITPEQFDRAQEAVLEEHARPVEEMPTTTHPFWARPAEREAAERAVERLNTLEVSDDDAGRYRLAPQENDLDWLREPEPRLGQDPSQLTQRGDFFDDLDFLRDELREERARDEERERERNR